MEYHDKEVVFHQYCPTCKYYALSGTEEPCNECLSNPINEDSHKPVKWEEK